MKKLLLIFMLFTIPLLAQTQSLGEGSYFTKNLWKLAGTVVSPANTAWTLTLPATTFSPSIVTPLIIGGADTISTLIYKTTTGVGKTGARHIFQVGTNGATEAMTILNDGKVGIGTTGPNTALEVNGVIRVKASATNGYATITGDGSGAIYSSNGDINIYTNNAVYDTYFKDANGVNILMKITNIGNVGIGTATAFPATLAKGLTIANGTAPTAKANSASLYVVLGEMWVYDSTGIATQISPHNKDGDWVFNSYDVETGERTYINMITLAETLEVLSGKTLIVRDNVLQEVQKKDAYEEYDSTITINKKVMEDEATSLVIDTVYSEIADTAQLVEYYTYDDKTKKVEKKTKYKIDKVPNYVSEWKIKDGYKLNETNGDFEKTTSTKKANRLKSNAKIKDGKYYIINLARQ